MESKPYTAAMPGRPARRRTSPTTVAAFLAEAEAMLSAVGIDTPRLDAEALLAHVLTIDRAQLFARLSEPVSRSVHDAFHRMCERRARREPLAYITGGREFWSLEFRVTPAVLIPRPETEIVVETALRLISQATGNRQQATGRHSALRIPHSALEGLRLLDVGTGSGCIAIALAKELPEGELWAVDTSPQALAVARDNARRHGVAERIRFLQGDLFFPLSRGIDFFDLIVSNPPYIPPTDLEALQPEVRDWEPREALAGGGDGLDFYRRLLDESPAYLRPGGWLIMELGAGQGPEVLRSMQARRNFGRSFSVRDYAGHERVAVAYKE